MFEGVLGSLVIKIVAVLTGLTAVAGGMAATGVLPGMSDAPEATAEVTTPAGSTGISTSTLPIGLDDLPAGTDAADALALVGRAQESADAAQAAATKCLNTANTQISALVAKLNGLTNPAQAQALVGTAGTIGTDAQKCAAEAQALARTSVDQATDAAGLAEGLDLAGLADLPGVSNPEDLLAQIMALVEGAGAAAAGAEDLALGIVNSVITSVGALLPIPGGEGGLPLPLPGGEGGLPLPIPGGEGGLPLPIPGVGDGGLPLPIPGAGEGGLPLPIPGAGEGGLPVPGLDGLGNPTDLAGRLAGTILGALGGGALPVPGL